MIALFNIPGVLTLEIVITFFLVFARMISMILTAPIFSNKDISSTGKIVLLLWISSLILFYIPLPIQFPNTTITLLFAVLVEIIIGMLLGFVTQLLIMGVEFAGSLMDNQAGLSVASMLDPASGLTTTLLSKIMRQLILLIFLLIDGHHVILGGLIQSFQVLPIASPFNLSEAAKFVVESSVIIFELALQLSAPILLVVFLIDFGFGMLSRVAPQVNVFQLGFQVKPIVSIFVFLSIIPGLVDLVYYLVERISGLLLQTLFLLRV